MDYQILREKSYPISQKDCSSLIKLHEKMYLHDQAMIYPPGLHIFRATNVKMVANRVCFHLLVWDASKKKGFKLYYKAQMPSR